MSPKKLQPDKLTLAQETYITIMWFQESRYAASSAQAAKVWVSGNFFVFHLGVQWSNYHGHLMIELERLGWLHSKKDGRTILYSLTDLARFAKNDHQVHAGKYAKVEMYDLPF